MDLCDLLLAGGDGVGLKEVYLGDDLACAGVEFDLRARFEEELFLREQLEFAEIPLLR